MAKLTDGMTPEQVKEFIGERAESTKQSVASYLEAMNLIYTTRLKAKQASGAGKHALLDESISMMIACEEFKTALAMTMEKSGMMKKGGKERMLEGIAKMAETHREQVDKKMKDEGISTYADFKKKLAESRQARAEAVADDDGSDQG